MEERNRRCVFKYVMGYQMEEGLVSKGIPMTNQLMEIKWHRLLLPYVFQASLDVLNWPVSCSYVNTQE